MKRTAVDFGLCYERIYVAQAKKKAKKQKKYRTKSVGEVFTGMRERAGVK